MSNHIEKYPGLYAGAKALGVQYQTMINRVRRGMTVEEALAKPVRPVKRHRLKVSRGPIGRPRKIERNDPGIVAKLYAWHRSGYQPLRRPERPKHKYVPHGAEDTSPPHIQAVRKRYCDNFIKAGEFDQKDLALLQAYAQLKREGKPEDARKKSHQAAQRVSTEHEARHEGGQPAPLRHAAGGDDQQPDVASAG